MIRRKLQKFKFFYTEYRNKKFYLLDVGCGNGSPSKAKKLFPRCVYHGIDKENYNRSIKDNLLMDKYFLLDLTSSDLSEIESEKYDVIIMSHIIEHLSNGDKVIESVLGKLKKGGSIYIEFPSVRSLSFPSMPGTLNFCDDETHVRIFDMKEVANICMRSGCKIVRAGTRRNLANILLFPAILISGIIKGQPASAFWDLLGFAEYVFAEKI